jgi:hypothetical protein
MPSGPISGGSCVGDDRQHGHDCDRDEQRAPDLRCGADRADRGQATRHQQCRRQYPADGGHVERQLLGLGKRQAETELDLQHDQDGHNAGQPGNNEEGAALEEARDTAGFAVARQRQRGEAARAEQHERVDGDIQRAIDEDEAEQRIEQNEGGQAAERNGDAEQNGIEPPHGGTVARFSQAVDLVHLRPMICAR